MMKKDKVSKTKALVENHIYIPTMDWWIMLVVCFLILLFLIAIPFFISQPLSTSEKIIASLGLVLTILYLVDVTFFTTYRLESDRLVIQNQIRSVSYYYRTIIKMHPGKFRNLFSWGKFKRFGLSANCLVIVTEAEFWPIFCVSPKDKQTFINDLLQHIDQERTSRAVLCK